jgi:LCP family protein required for cell wall assembly
MPDNYYEPDEPTLPANYPARNQEQQGKLVVGSFQNQSRPAQRRPYQYPPQPRQSQPGYPQSPVQPPASSEVPRPYPNQAYPQQWQAANGPGAYPPYQPARRPRRRSRRPIGCLIALLIVFLLGYFIISTGQRVLAFGSAISNQPPLSTQTGYMGGSDRVNLLVMGYGGGNHSGAYLTDSMSVVSVMPQSHHTSIISVPRDLWVQVPAGSGNYAKLNTVYTVGSNNGQNPVAGGEAAAQKIALITGLDAKSMYWVTINFTGFRDLINSLGGIDVYVPDSFNACYPKNDDASVDASWKVVQFNKGMQHMDGETAIEYARAREPMAVCGHGASENLAELTDFARSARQQIIIKAVLSKVKQPGTWPHLFDAMTALQHTIYTNMSLADLALFATKMDLNDPHTAHIGLSNQNVLVDSVSSDAPPPPPPPPHHSRLLSAAGAEPSGKERT